MPSFGFTLPHWAYWIGLIVFPLVAMMLARQSRSERREYKSSLGYMILVTGGMVGLHRFYLKNMLGLLYLPLFLAVLFANSQSNEARSALSDATNQVSLANSTIEREEKAIRSAEDALPQLRSDLVVSEAGSFARRSIEKQVSRAEKAIETANTRIAESNAAIVEFQPRVDQFDRQRSKWQNVAKYAFYLICLFLLVDIALMPKMVRAANATIDHDAELAAEIAENAKTSDDIETLKADAEWVSSGWTGWIDRLSLYAGEFVSYWAVIAVIVYYFEVISRYVFNSPTNWAHESMYLMFGMQYLIAGAYAMLTESHVRVDIFYAPLSERRKAIVDLLTSVFFFIFAFTLLFTSFIFAHDAIAVPTGNSIVSDWARGEIGFWQMIAGIDLGLWLDPNIRWGEISFNEWEIPLWPMKWVMVIGGLLLVLQGISKLAQDVQKLVKVA